VKSGTGSLRSGKRVKTAVTAGVVAAGVIAGIALGGSSGQAAPGDSASGPDSRGASASGAADESKDFKFPGADTMALHDGSGKYITYGASSRGKKVPYSVSGSGDVVGTSPKIAGDAMPHGGGDWAKKGGVWTPGAFYHTAGGVGRYYLFYTAVPKSGPERHCVGVASSKKPASGFKAEARPLVCPPKRWAIDADVTTGPGGAVWMTWRDGGAAEGAESALSAMRLKFRQDGTVDRASKTHVLLRSDKLTWAHYKDGAGVTVIENPSALYNRGSWYLFYSGNSWPTNYYATGIANCGAELGKGACEPMPGPRKAWFSYAGPKKHLPAKMRKYGLPGNKRGPGAMDVYRARDGKPWVTWNYLSDESKRKSRTGRLSITGKGSSADFKVSLP
jgi:hypothetical protein